MTREPHERVLRALLSETGRPHPAGSIVPLPFLLAGDLRARQLRKLAH